MTVTIVGTWEISWNTPIKEVEQWQYPLMDYGVDKFYMAPVSGIRNSAVTEVHDMGELLNQLRAENKTIVFVDENGTETLEEFIHPENAVYVFGKASLSPLIAYNQPGDISLKIMTPNNLATLWPHQAAVLILDDRWKKNR